MRTTKEEAERILTQIQQVADARIRSMMGEYIVYVNDKVIGQINHSELFIKVTQFGEGFAGTLKKEPPYDGAKLMFIIPADKIQDTHWLKEFITGTVEQL